MYFYQQIDDIGKEIAVISSLSEMTDKEHYREITEDYYTAVAEFLAEQASSEDFDESKKPPTFEEFLASQNPEDENPEELKPIDDTDGSYIHPFVYEIGMPIVEGMWYIFPDDNIWEAIVTSDYSEYTSEYFDIIE